MNKFPRDILNEIKWRYDSLNEVEIFYINRGSPDNMTSKLGKDIISMDGFSIEFFGIPQNTYIPYHRIRKIIYRGDIVFKRRINIV